MKNARFLRVEIKILRVIKFFENDFDWHHPSLVTCHSKYWSWHNNKKARVFFYLTSWQVMIILALLSFKNEKLKLIYVYVSISYKDFTMQTVIKVSLLTDQIINFWKSSFGATWPIAFALRISDVPFLLSVPIAIHYYSIRFFPFKS